MNKSAMVLPITTLFNGLVGITEHPYNYGKNTLLPILNDSKAVWGLILLGLAVFCPPLTAFFLGAYGPSGPVVGVAALLLGAIVYNKHGVNIIANTINQIASPLKQSFELATKNPIGLGLTLASSTGVALLAMAALTSLGAIGVGIGIYAGLGFANGALSHLNKHTQAKPPKVKTEKQKITPPVETESAAAPATVETPATVTTTTPSESTASAESEKPAVTKPKRSVLAPAR